MPRAAVFFSLFRVPEGQGQPTAAGGGGQRGVLQLVQTCLPPWPWRREWAATKDAEPGCSGLRRPQTNSLGDPACAPPSTSRARDAAHSTWPLRLARDARVWRRRAGRRGAGSRWGCCGLPGSPALRPRVPPVPGAWCSPLHCRPGAGTSPFLRLFLPQCARAWALCHAQGGTHGQKGGRGGAGRARAQSCGLSPGPSVTHTPPGHLTVGWSL